MGSNYNLNRLLGLLIMVIGLFTFGATNPAPMAATSASLPTPTSGWHSGWNSPGVGGTLTGEPTKVLALASNGNSVYVGGNFTTAGGHNANSIAVWQTASQTWDVLGSASAPQGNGTNGVVHAIEVLPNGNLIVGGIFTEVYNGIGNSLSANNLAGWNPTTQQWFAFGGTGAANNGVDGPVYTVAVVNNDTFYVGGSFGEAMNAGGTLAVNNLVRWQFGFAIGSNGTWHRLGDSNGNGANDVVRALHWEPAIGTAGDLFVGGDFLTVSNGVTTTNASRIARWFVPSIGSPSWHALDTGTDGPVYAITRFVGGDGHLYIGGDFTAAGATNAQNIAYWQGSAWNKLGTASLVGTKDPVYALENIGVAIIVGGEFLDVYDPAAGTTSKAARVAFWLGGSWSRFGIGTTTDSNGVRGFTVNALLDGPTGYFVGGTFYAVNYSETSTLPAANIVRWSIGGMNWANLSPTDVTTNGASPDPSFAQPGVADLLVASSTLYATGAFSGLGSTRTRGVGAFFGGNWQLMGGPSANSGFANNGLFGEGRRLAWDSTNNRPMIVGNFGFACNGPSGHPTTCVQAGGVAFWTSGSGYSAVNTQTFGIHPVTNVVHSGANTFFVSGFFDALPDGSSANYVAYYNGSAYQRLGADTGSTGNGLNAHVQALAWDATNSRLFVGGGFATAYNSNGSPVTVNGIAVWNGSSWSALPGGGIANGAVSTLLVHGNYLYVGGNFSQAGSVAVRGLARYHLTNNTWEAVGLGTEPGVLATLFPTTGQVFDLAVHNSYLYVGGKFQAVYHNNTYLAANNFARVDLFTMEWEGYGDGPNGNVYTIAVDSSANRIYAGGYFSRVGKVPAADITALTPSATPIPGLVVERIGPNRNNGIITSDIHGINCWGDVLTKTSGCTYGYPYTSQVTLTASVNNPAYVFGGWGGACAAEGHNPTCTVTLNADTHVTAYFTTLTTLTINKTGDGDGTVISNPSGINCGATCDFSLPAGAIITLTAAPNATSWFNSWSGVTCAGGSNNPTCQFTLNSNQTVTAHFSPTRMTVNVLTVGASTGGTVVSSPAGINCTSGACIADFPSGAEITLTATPNIGSKFNGWGGNCSSAVGLQCTITLVTTLVAEAVFGEASNLVYLPLLQR